jgi:hypothetical protein
MTWVIVSFDETSSARANNTLILKMDYWKPERLAYCTPLVELVDRD